MPKRDDFLPAPPAKPFQHPKHLRRTSSGIFRNRTLRTTPSQQLTVDTAPFSNHLAPQIAGARGFLPDSRQDQVTVVRRSSTLGAAYRLAGDAMTVEYGMTPAESDSSLTRDLGSFRPTSKSCDETPTFAIWPGSSVKLDANASHLRKNICRS